MDFSQKRARRNPKITKMDEKIDFLVDQNLSSNFGRKKTEKKRIDCLKWSLGELGLHHVRGRWEGKGGQASQTLV